MNRSEFIRTCSLSCLTLVGLSTGLSSCAGSRHLQRQPENGSVRLTRSDFSKGKDGKFLRSLIINVEGLQYPVAVYRLSENDFRALLLQCSHQQMELSVSGDLLTCPAHGSEFNIRGEAVQGPAEQPLKQFRVVQDDETILIYLV